MKYLNVNCPFAQGFPKSNWKNPLFVQTIQNQFFDDNHYTSNLKLANKKHVKLSSCFSLYTSRNFVSLKAKTL